MTRVEFAFEYVIEGGRSRTTTVRLKLLDPPVFVAVIVWTWEAATEIGVPLITPEDVLIASPDGKAGDTDQVVIVPPETVGDRFVIKVFITNVAVADA
jgi:hypothetical protein